VVLANPAARATGIASVPKVEPNAPVRLWRDPVAKPGERSALRAKANGKKAS
jgi:hypothetical protein